MSLAVFGLDHLATGTSGVVTSDDGFQLAPADPAGWIRLVGSGGALERYAEYLAGIGMSERTLNVYSRAVARFWAHAAGEGFDPVDAGALELGVYAQTLAPSTKRQQRAALRHWFESMGRIDTPLNAMRVPPKKRGVSRALEPDEASRLARVSVDIQHPGGMAVLLGLYLGLRREEISRARWDHFDADFEWYTFMGKLEIEATLPVHPVLRDALVPHMTAFPSVFPGRSTMYVSPGTIWRWIGDVGDAASVKNLAPHQLRHTAIATVNDATGDLRMAQEFARHADITTTQIYTRVRKDRLMRAIGTLNYLGPEGADT